MKTTLNQAPKSVISGQHNTGVVQVLTDAVTADDIESFPIAPDGEWVIVAAAKLSRKTIMYGDANYVKILPMKGACSWGLWISTLISSGLNAGSCACSNRPEIFCLQRREQKRSVQRALEDI
jgi:hypothetical protein